MQLIGVFLILMIQTFVSQALPLKSSYQVDLIIFAHTDSLPVSQENFLSPKWENAQPFYKNSTNNLYTLLPQSASHLKAEYFSLRNKTQYQILAHYSWIQPVKKQKKLLFQKVSQNGWQLEGVISLAQNQYFLLDTQLLISTIDNEQRFIFAKKERLKANNLYYLDSPGAGMFIRIQT